MIRLEIPLALALVLGALGCGRSGLDSGLDTTNVTVDPSSPSSTGGAAGGAQSPTARSVTPIPCGGGTCTAGAQVCCVGLSNRRRTETCISVTDTCQSGASVGCVDSGNCGAGHVCCESLLLPATSCELPDTCLRTPGVILCGVDADCPSSSPHCCQAQDLGVCAAAVCPSDTGDMGSGDGVNVSGGPGSD